MFYISVKIRHGVATWTQTMDAVSQHDKTQGPSLICRRPGEPCPVWAICLLLQSCNIYFSMTANKNKKINQLHN